MGLKKVVIGWAQNVIYSLLIFCIGGVGSLAYFDAFLPGHAQGHHPYHLSILEESVHVHNPLPPLPEAEVLALFTTAYQSTVPNGKVCFCHLSPSHDYLLTVIHINLFSDTSLFNRILVTTLVRRSIWLSLPDKPPQPYSL